MPLSDVLTLTIERRTKGVTKAGFGTTLFVGWDQRPFGERELVKTYADIADVLADFDSTTPEYCAAARMWSQPNKPTALKISSVKIDAATLGLLLEAVAVGSAARLDFYTSAKTVAQRTGAADFTVTATRAGGDTAATLAGKLADAINALHGFGWTASVDDAGGGPMSFISIAPSEGPGSGAGKRLRWTASPSAAWIPVPGFTPATMPATFMPLLMKADSDFYPVVLMARGREYQVPFADYMETQRRMFFAATADPRMVSATFGEDDTGGALYLAAYVNSKSYARTAVIYHSRASFACNGYFTNYSGGSGCPDTLPDFLPPTIAAQWVSFNTSVTMFLSFMADATADEWIDAGWIQSRIYIDPDAETINWKFATIVGATPDSIDGNEAIRLKSVRANWYETIGGVNIVQEGWTPGDYIDTMTGVDWLWARMVEAEIRTMTQNKKIPFTDDGSGTIAGAIRAVLSWGMTTGLLYKDTTKGPQGYFMRVPTRAETDPNDRAERHLKGVQWGATLAGAINKASINGYVEV